MRSAFIEGIRLLINPNSGLAIKEALRKMTSLSQRINNVSPMTMKTFERKLVERKLQLDGNWFRCAIRGTRVLHVIELSNTNSVTRYSYSASSLHFQYISNAFFKNRYLLVLESVIVIRYVKISMAFER